MEILLYFSDENYQIQNRPPVILPGKMASKRKKTHRVLKIWAETSKNNN